MKVTIIGGGPAGITAAYILARGGVQVDLYEADTSVGGMSRSINLWGQTVDLGPHRFFSTDRRVNELWLEIVRRDYVMVRRLTRILYSERFFRYPLEPLDALRKLGVVESVRCVLSYVAQKWTAHAQKNTFEDWVCNRFGRRLFRIFFKTYSEKLWGIPCDEIDSDFAAQRIKKFSLFAAIKAALFKNGAQQRTLVDEFAYPTGGTGMVFQRMAESIAAHGGRVYLNQPVKRVLTENGKVRGVELQSGAVHDCTNVISTMPLPLLVQRLSNVPPAVSAACRQLTFRNTILVYLELASTSVCPDQWVYVHTAGLRTGRITNFRNWVPQLCGNSRNTIVAMEYWCEDGAGQSNGETRNGESSTNELWSWTDEELIALARRELVLTTLVSDPSLILNGSVFRIPRSYPVYRRGYKDVLRPIQEYLSRISGLQVIGRYGAFKYNNQDHSILMGILAAENLMKNKGYDLWSVNADYETYQEGCKITETGLAAA